MLVILRPDQYDEWHYCSAEDPTSFFTRYPVDRLVGHAAPKQSRASMQEIPLGDR
jgi:hypothetical protein